MKGIIPFIISNTFPPIFSVDRDHSLAASNYKEEVVKMKSWKRSGGHFFTTLPSFVPVFDKQFTRRCQLALISILHKAIWQHVSEAL